MAGRLRKKRLTGVCEDVRGGRGVVGVGEVGEMTATCLDDR